MEVSKIIEIIAFITGICVFHSIRPPFLKLLIPLLLVTIFVENYLIIVFDANFVYNIYSLIDMGVWFYLFYCILTRKKIRVLIIIAATICFSYALIELLYLRSWTLWRADSFRIYNLSIILFATLYFYEINKKEYHNIFIDPLFWISSACFLFHLLFFFNNTIMGQLFFWKLSNAKIVFVILQATANIVYYFLLCIGLIVCFYKSRLEQVKY